MTRARSPIAVFSAMLLIVLLLLFAASIRDILLLFFIAVLFSLYLGAITTYLDRKLDLPRVWGLVAAVLVSLAALGVVVWLIVPPVLQQMQDLLVALPGLLAQWQHSLAELARRYPLIGQMVETGDAGAATTATSPLATLGDYFKGVFPYVATGFHLLILFFSVLVMGIYMALRPGIYEEGFIRLIPPVHRDLVRDILRDLTETLRAWIVGQILAMLFLGVLTWIGLVILRVPFALAFGVLTGLVAVVPFFGTLVSTLLPALFVLGSQGTLHALFVVLLGVVLHLVEANFVHPLIMERQVHLPPVLSILSVLVMAELIGPIGLLVAVPVLATVIVVVRRIYVERVLEGKGFRRSLRSRPVGRFPRRPPQAPPAPSPSTDSP
jgi:predicted PurR-regulated permease PerM